MGPGVCLYANPPWTLIGRVLAKIAEDGARVLLVTPHWKEAPWYELLMELTVRIYEWRGRLYLTEGGICNQFQNGLRYFYMWWVSEES